MFILYTSRSHTSNILKIVLERLAARAAESSRVWWSKSQSSLLNIYFRLSGSQFSLLFIHFRYGPTSPKCGQKLSDQWRSTFEENRAETRHSREWTEAQVWFSFRRKSHRYSGNITFIWFSLWYLQSNLIFAKFQLGAGEGGEARIRVRVPFVEDYRKNAQPEQCYILYREKTVYIKTHKTAIIRPVDHTGET